MFCRLRRRDKPTRVSRRAAISLCGSIAALVACGGDASAEPDAEPDTPPIDAGPAVSYADDVRPIFQACVICHGPGSVTRLDLTDPFDPEHGLVNRTNTWHEAHDSPFELLVKPGSPDESFLIYKVAADPDPEVFDTANNGGPMPLQVPRVSAAELVDIRRWIDDGARNDASFSETIAPIFGTEVTLGGRRGKCTLCHYPGSFTGLVILDVFDAELGLVGAESIQSTKLRVAPGSSADSFLVDKLELADPDGGAQMPLHYPRLTDAQVDTLRAWIAQGAKDN
jgi:mono/diheme cytochrome c family protein